MDSLKAKRWLPAFKYFCSLVSVVSKELEAPGPITLYTAQNLALEQIEEGLKNDVRHFVFLKARQLGISTIFLLLDMFWLYMHPGLQGAFVCDNAENREIFRETIKQMMESLPKGFQIPVVKHDRTMLVLGNGSRLQYMSAGTGKNAKLGRSRGLNFLHATELGQWGDPKGYETLMDTLALENPNRLYLFESTALGFNLFWDCWKDALDMPESRSAVFIGWWAKEPYQFKEGSPDFERWWGAYPAYTEYEQRITAEVYAEHEIEITPEQWAWYRAKADGRSEQSVMEEYPALASEAFQSTGHPFFSLQRITADMTFIREQSISYQGYKYELGDNFLKMRMRPASDIEEVTLRVWEKPQPNGKYVIGVDPAYGSSEEADSTCLDADTEILTRNGWRNCDQVAIGDEAVCFDLASETYRYGFVSDKILKDYAGPMHHFQGDGLDCLVTPEHRVVVRKCAPLRGGRRPKWRVETAGDIASRPTTNQQQIPVGGAPVGEGLAGVSLDQCRVIGWMLTDGHISRPTYAGDGSRAGKKRIRSRLVLVQSVDTTKMNIRVADEMRLVMPRVFPGVVVTERPAAGRAKAQVKFQVNVAEAEPFVDLIGGRTKRIPRAILTYGSLEQLNALFQGILEGDGSWNKKNGRWQAVHCGLDGGLAGDVQELAAKLGHSATAVLSPSWSGGVRCKDQWIVRLSSRRGHSYHTKDIATVPYSGKVWCVTVPTGAFVARRNGRMFVTGNCISVWRCFADKLVQVAEYASPLTTTQNCAWVLGHLAGEYRDCMINLEYNGGGGEVAMEMKHLRQSIQFGGLMNVARDMKVEHALDSARWFYWRRPDSIGGQPSAHHFTTNGQNKPIALNRMNDAYISNQLIIRSIPLLDEMTTMKREGDKIAASGRNKDDRVMSAMLACYAWKEWIQPGLMSQNRTHEREMREQLNRQVAGADVLAQIVPSFLQEQAERRSGISLKALLEGPLP